MDINDVFSHRRLLYKCDSSITKIYQNIIKMATSAAGQAIDEQLKTQTIKQIDVIIFQIFKYKTALISLQKDISGHELIQKTADEQIQNSKKQIKQLTQEVKSAQLVRRRKMEYNEIANSVKEFDTNAQFNIKIKNIQHQVQKLNNQHKSNMEAYAEKQRCIKMALSALKMLIRDDAQFDQSPSNY